MASTLAVGVQINILPTLASVIGNFPIQIANFVSNFSSGTTAQKADRVYFQQRTASTGGDSIDVNGGGLLQPDQSAFSIVEMVLMLVINRDASINITVGGGTNAAVVVGDPIKPGGVRYWYEPGDPAIVTAAGASDIVKVVSASGTPAYDILIIGRSA